MTSKNLFFKLQKEDIKRRIWTIAISILVFFLTLPVYTAMTIENYNAQEYQDRASMIEHLLKIIGPSFEIVIIATIVGAIICGLSGFFYLHSRKKVDFYHSTPIHREVLFAISYINGLLIYLIPYVFNIILCFIVLGIKNFMSFEMFTTALCAIGVNLLYFCLIYTIVVIAVMLTGNFIVSCFGTAVFILYGPILMALKEMYFCDFFDTYYGSTDYSIFMKFLSPVGSYFNTIKKLVSESNQGISASIIKTLIVTILLICLAVLLYKKRPSEAAGKAMAFEISKPIIKFLLVIPFALGGGIIFRDISYNGSYAWFIFGLIFSLIIVYAIVEIIYNFDIRSAFRYKKQLFACAGIMAVVVCIFQFDIFRYDSYMPRASKIESMSVDISGLDDEYQYVDLETDDFNYMNSDTYQLKYMELTNFSAAYNLAKLGKEDTENQRHREGYYTYNVKYKLKNGREVFRTYDIKSNENIDLLKEIFANAEFKEGHYPIYKIKAEQITSISCYNMLSSKEFSLDNKEKKQLLEIYEEDLNNFSFDDLISNDPLATIRVDLDDISFDNYIYPSFTNTIDFLKNHGFDATTKLTAKNIKSIQVDNYVIQSEEDTEYSENGNEELYLTEPTKDSVTYVDEEKINEIFPSLLGCDYVGRNRIILNSDPNLMVTIVVRKDEYGNDESYSFYFKKGEIPDFVKKDVGYVEK